jgi:hypothetical protein
VSSLFVSLLVKEVRESAVGGWEEFSLGPKIGGKITVGLSKGIVSSENEVLEGLGRSLSGSEAILHTSELKNSLGGGG